MRNIHIGIRPQLTISILLVVGISVTIFAIVTGVNTTKYVVNLRGERLNVVAELKASQISQAFLSLVYQVSWIASREPVQTALSRYRAGSHSEENWTDLDQFFNSTLGTYSVIVGVGLYALDFTNMYNKTNSTVGPYGSLDPNLFPLKKNSPTPPELSEFGGTIRGPSMLDPNHYMSVTLPVQANTTLFQEQATVGYVTMVLNSQTIRNVVDDQTGLNQGSVMSLMTPVPGFLANNSYEYFRYLFPPSQDQNQMQFGLYSMDQYPAVQQALQAEIPGTASDTHNPFTDNLMIGYALADVNFGVWVVCVEELSRTIWQPVNRLRVIVICTSFGLAAFIVLITIPVAHFAVKPIYRLRNATEQTRMEFHEGPFPPPAAPSTATTASANTETDGDELAKDASGKHRPPRQKVKSTWELIKGWFSIKAYQGEKAGMSNSTTSSNATETGGTAGTSDSRRFKVPNHVPIPGKFFRDELTDLSETFNRMADELVKQYLNLEDRVAERTKEVGAAKTAAENANEAKSLFIANITHELRTPLNGILGMTAVSLTENDTGKIKRSLQVIYKSGELLLNLLSDLLTFSKNQIGSLQLDEKEFMLREVYTNVKSLFQSNAQEKHISFTVDVPNESTTQQMVLYGDSSRILQIMINLVSNAMKFTPKGGNVAVRIRNLGEIKHNRTNTLKTHSRNVSTESNKSAVTRSDSLIRPLSVISGHNGKHDVPRDLMFEFEVEDNGPGVAEELKEQIFEPFVQGDQALSRKHGGTGLGLSICKQLAELMGGKIVLKSTPGKGATFTLQIPLKNTRIVAPSEHSEGLSRHNSTSSQIAAVQHQHQQQSSPVSVVSPLSELTSGSTDLIRTDSTSSRQSDGYFKSSYKHVGHLRSGSSSSISRAENVRVLVAEDNVVNQEIMKRMLRLEGINDITIAMDGQKVIEKVEQAIKDGMYYDIIFMDIQMPKVNGLEATRVMRGTLGYPYTIIAMTAYADKKSETDCIEAGMNGVITKPILRNALHKILTDYCPGAPLHEPALTPTDNKL